MCARVIDFSSFYDFSIAFWNCSYSVVFYHIIISGHYTYCFLLLDVCLLMFNATFNTISVISWWSLLLVDESGGPGENQRPVASD